MGKMIAYPKLDDQGRVTVPMQIRVALDLHPGDILEITIKKYLNSRK